MAIKQGIEPGKTRQDIVERVLLGVDAVLDEAHAQVFVGSRPIASIRRKEIVRLLDDIEDNNGQGQADTILAIIRRIMNWHATRDDDFRSPIVRGMRRDKEPPRERILDDDEIRAVWRAADSTSGPFGHCIKFLLLTAYRRNEATHLTRREIVGEDWFLPAERNKTKVNLKRPLSRAA